MGRLALLHHAIAVIRVAEVYLVMLVALSKLTVLYA